MSDLANVGASKGRSQDSGFIRRCLCNCERFKSLRRSIISMVMCEDYRIDGRARIAPILAPRGLRRHESPLLDLKCLA